MREPTDHLNNSTQGFKPRTVNSTEVNAPADSLCRVLLLSLDTPWAARFRSEVLHMGWQLKRLDSPYDALASIADYDPHLLVVSDFRGGLTVAEICDALRVPRVFRPLQIIVTTAVTHALDGDPVELGIDEILPESEHHACNGNALNSQFRLARLSRTVVSREQEILDGLPTAIFVVDSQYALWKLNREFSTALGCDDPKLLRNFLGKPLDLTVQFCTESGTTPLAETELHTALSTAMRSGKQSFRFKQVVRNREQTFSGRITKLSTETDRFLIDLLDITEEENLLKQEAQRERLATIGNLALGVAHEIQNPNTFNRVNAANLQELLSALKPLLAALEKENPDLRAGKLSVGKALEMMTNSVNGVALASDRIGQVLDTLRNFGKSDTSRIIQINPLSSIREAIVLTRHACKNVCDLLLELPEDLPAVMASHTELSQVFVNLIQNAVHAFAEPIAQKRGNGKAIIRIALEHVTEKELVIAVIDNGPGIDPAIQSRIFRPYFTTRAMGEGTGLGLSLSSDIMHRFGGDVSVRSRPADGAVFLVTIPLACDIQTNTLNGEVPHAVQTTDC